MNKKIYLLLKKIFYTNSSSEITINIGRVNGIFDQHLLPEYHIRQSDSFDQRRKVLPFPAHPGVYSQTLVRNLVEKPERRITPVLVLVDDLRSVRSREQLGIFLLGPDPLVSVYRQVEWLAVQGGGQVLLAPLAVVHPTAPVRQTTILHRRFVPGGWSARVTATDRGSIDLVGFRGLPVEINRVSFSGVIHFIIFIVSPDSISK